MIHSSWLLSIILLAKFVTLDKPAYRIFDKDGEVVSYDTMVQSLAGAQVILFGELHNNALAHWLELQVAQDLHHQNSGLVLGLEMLEADNQLLLNEYLAEVIEERHFKQEAKLWDNYATDYQPLVSFAKKNKVPVVATNVPRRYASLVSRKGVQQLDSLPDVVQQWIAPLPIEVDTELPGYQNMLEMMDGMQGHGGMSGENMVQAQAIKDATMAYFIQQNLAENSPFLHINGSYHSDNFEGIYWYLKQIQPELTIKTISCIEQSSLDSLNTDTHRVADFIIAIPDDMTKTY